MLNTVSMIISDIIMGLGSILLIILIIALIQITVIFGKIIQVVKQFDLAIKEMDISLLRIIRFVFTMFRK